MMRKWWSTAACVLLVMASSALAGDNLDTAGRFFNDGKYWRAGRYAKKALKEDPTDIQAAILLAESYSERGKARPAVETYKEIILKYPENVDLVFRMGLVYNKFDYHQNAVEVYRQILEKKPDHVLARYRLGLSLSQCMDLSGAYAEYRRLKPLDKKLADDLLQHIQTNK